MQTGIGLNLKKNEISFWIKDNGEKGHEGDCNLDIFFGLDIHDLSLLLHLP